jgi:hypothetical protein
LENLYIESSERTPKIDFRADGTLYMSGESYPEDSRKFYIEVFDWFDEFIKSNPEKAHLTLKMRYFNSSSSKVIYEIFDLMEELAQNNTDTTVIWMYDEEDDTMEEYGVEFKEDFEDMNIELKSY